MVKTEASFGPRPASPASGWTFATLALLPSAACVNGEHASLAAAELPHAEGLRSSPLTYAPPSSSPIHGPAPLSPDPSNSAPRPLPRDDSLLSSAWDAVEDSWLDLVHDIQDPQKREEFCWKQAFRYATRLHQQCNGESAPVDARLSFRVGAGSAEPRISDTDKLLRLGAGSPLNGPGSGDEGMPIRVGVSTGEIFSQSSNFGVRCDVSSIDVDWKHLEIHRATIKPAVRWNNFTLAGEIGGDQHLGIAVHWGVTF